MVGAGAGRSAALLVAMVRGEAWVVPDRGGADSARGRRRRAPAGRRAVCLRDDPATSPQVVIHPGQHCTTPDGHDLSQQMDLGVRSWGNDPNGSSVFLIGTYEHQSELSRRLVDALPPHVILSSEQWSSPLLGLLADQITKDEPGQHVVLDRLLDLIVIAVLRAWFSLQGANAPAWYLGLGDPIVGRALRMMQNNPAHPWTVAGLASEVGVRAGSRRRFTEVVGEPPMSLLTSWRFALAADQLRDSDAGLGTVASRVGYGSALRLSALRSSAAYGVSPTTYRRGELARAAG